MNTGIIKNFILLINIFLLVSCGGGGKKNNTDPTDPGQNKTPPGIVQLPAITSDDASATLSWPQVPGADSYNIYMAQQSGVTKDNWSSLQNGMKHADVTSPFFHAGLTNGTTYYFIITAKNSDGESSATMELAATPKSAAPGTPKTLTAEAGDSVATLSWPEVAGATSYNVYWSNSDGVNKNNGKLIENVSPPFQHNIHNGTRYFYVVTAVNQGVESEESGQVSVIPQGVLPPPETVTATGSDGTVTIEWSDVPGAVSYNLYMASEPGVTKSSYTNLKGNMIHADITSPFVHTGLTNDTQYYFVVTAVNVFGESAESMEVDAAPVAPPPKDPNKFLSFLNTSSPRYQENEQTALAYYAAIDPLNQKTTLSAWKAANGFGTGVDPEADVPAVYLNDADLGFGRRMHVITHPDGSVASYVENYPTLIDAINETNIIATVAMEYGPPPEDPAAATKQVVIGANDDIETNNSTITYTLDPGTTYTVVAARNDQLELGTFTLKITNEDGKGTTRTLLGKWTQPAITTWDQTDPFEPRYTLNNSTTAAQTVTINLNADISPWLYLLDSQGQILDENGGDFVVDSRVSMPLKPGNYTIVAATHRDAVSGNYTLDVTDSGGASLLSTSGSWAPSGGENAFSPDNPRVSFTLTKTDVITFNLSSPDVDTFLYVLGDVGDYRHVVAENDDLYDAIDDAQISQPLAAGTYTVVAATNATGNAGKFTLDILDSKGVALPESTTGTWLDSGGQDPNSANNPHYSLTVPADKGGEVFTINLRADTHEVNPFLYLLDDTGKVVALNDDYGTNKSYIDVDLLPGSYQIVAATDDSDSHASFTLDVTRDGVPDPQISGAWTNSQEQNPYSPSNPRYNLELTKTTHVTIKLSSNIDTWLYLLDKGDAKYTKFYTFAPDGTRLTKANLDGRGDKYQPGVCNVCHGGRPKSLVNGVYPNHGDTNAGFLPWDLDLYKFSATYSRQAQESKFKTFNHTVLAIQTAEIDYDNTLGPSRSELIHGWYGGPDLPSDTFNGNFVPLGWLPAQEGGYSSTPPEAKDLYLQVVKPTCRACHIQRGNTGNLSIQFNSYHEFLAYQEELESMVYDKGVMPLARRTFNHFWQSGRANILGQYLSGFTHGLPNSDKTLKPGRPIAVAGPLPRTGNFTAPVGQPVQLNGLASLFAENYHWIIAKQPAGSNVTLDDPTSATPSFTPSVSGNYVVDLTVDNNTTESPIASVTISADAVSTSISFNNDIKPIMSGCAICHYDPVLASAISYGKRFYSEPVASRILQLDGADLYQRVIERINLIEPMDSMILVRVYDHSRGTSTGFVPDYPSYDLILKWILEGAQNN